MRELPIDMTSGIPMVNIKIWNRKKALYRSMLATLDTGATVTTLSKDILHLLGYDGKSKEKKRITTASGIEYVDEVIVDKIMFSSFELHEVIVYAHTFPQESFASGGVIGINVLSQFDLHISFKNKVLQLTPVF
jgi:predicted aspartyl protease